MFTKEDVDSFDYTCVNLENYNGLNEISYTDNDFKHPEACEYIRITRRKKRDEDNGVNFMFHSYLADIYYGVCTLEGIKDGLQTSNFEQITEDRFYEMVQAQCVGLIDKPNLPLSYSKFIGALVMCDLKTEFVVDVFAEYEDEYIHFFWNTTA